MKPLKLSIVMIMAIAVMAMTLPNQVQGQDREKMAKERKEMGERIKASKIAFITEQVDLSPEEAEKFWPIYNEQNKKREELTHTLMERFKGHEENLEISNEQAEEMMQQGFKQEEALLDLKREYHKKFTEILSATKVMKLYHAENNFRRGLMERLGHREGERKPEGRGMAPPLRERPHHR
ncbi:MAG: hypothetical protein KAT76_04290 [Bacteroidales bacterium]|nr:hypothetical protein [Bacteroidales bacterium]